jgi:hypothetical protein
MISHFFIIDITLFQSIKYESHNLVWHVYINFCVGMINYSHPIQIIFSKYQVWHLYIKKIVGMFMISNYCF